MNGISSQLASRIVTAIKTNSYVGGCIEGPKGIGKTVYCMRVGHQVYRWYYDCNDTQGWRYVLQNMLFTIKDVIDRLTTATNENVIIPQLTWDDTLVHASSILYFLEMREVNELKSVIETVRTGTNSLLLNCTDRSGLLGFLKKSDDILVEIVKAQAGGYSRVARAYHVFKLPSGKRLIYKDFEDDFSCRIPDSVYSVYYERRKKYLADALKRYKELTERSERSAKYQKIKLSLEEMQLDMRVEKLRRKGIDIPGLSMSSGE